MLPGASPEPLQLYTGWDWTFPCIPASSYIPSPAVLSHCWWTEGSTTQYISQKKYQMSHKKHNKNSSGWGVSHSWQTDRGRSCPQPNNRPHGLAITQNQVGEGDVLCFWIPQDAYYTKPLFSQPGGLIYLLQREKHGDPDIMRRQSNMLQTKDQDKTPKISAKWSRDKQYFW